MGRRTVGEVEAEREDMTKQPSLLFPTTTRVKADQAGLDRLTWRDHVDFGDSQTPASRLPAWKLSWRAGALVCLFRHNGSDREVLARVVCDAAFPSDFRLPVMVQVDILLDGRVVDTTTIPATAIAEVVRRHDA